VRSVVLDAVTPSLLVISRGVAHGFKALEDNTLLVYKTSSEHAPSHDTGIHWNSFGFDWQCDTPILSPRDQALPAFAAFGPTPFER
jgi:dTDP-4-dehydrorhamnose 3,5-epimerase-like enzyme